MASLTTRISRASHRALREMSESSGEPMQAIIEKAIEEYRRKHFWQRVNEAYAALRKNRKAWRDELKERKAWEATLSDGLKD